MYKYNIKLSHSKQQQDQIKSLNHIISQQNTAGLQLISLFEKVQNSQLRAPIARHITGVKFSKIYRSQKNQ